MRKSVNKSRREFWGFLTFGIVISSAFGCLWDRDTLRDELKVGAIDFDLITGQIPHHSDAYYEKRVSEMSQKDGALNDSERNDLAVAYIRLERYEEANVLLLKNLEKLPDDYFTLSNLGVLEKKRGNYKVAGEFISKALKIKPEGHLSLGDWYLNMIKFRALQKENPDSVPEKNFLGVDYRDGIHREMSTGEIGTPKGPDESEFYQRLKRLLANDQTFADGFVVMGDYLARKGQLHLAFLSYTRALNLRHANDPQIRARRRAILNEWQAASSRRIPSRTEFWKQEIGKAEDHLKKASVWSAQFKKYEAEILTTKTGVFPTFQETLTEMEKSKVSKYRPQE